jgi:hypothetical protein
MDILYAPETDGRKDPAVAMAIYIDLSIKRIKAEWRESQPFRRDSSLPAAEARNELTGTFPLKHPAVLFSLHRKRNRRIIMKKLGELHSFLLMPGGN